MVSLLAFVLSIQPASAPTLPPGSSVMIHETIERVEQALAKNDHVAARTGAALLPKRTFAIGWDDASIPDVLRDQVDEMRDLAIQAWSRVYGLHISIKTKGDVDIKFVDHCPNGTEGVPQASLLTFGDDPRLTVLVSLKRGEELESIVPVDAYVQVAHAIGTYLGVANDPLLGSCMHREDQPNQRAYGPAPKDLYVAENVLSISDQLRKDANNGTSIQFGEPSVSLAPAVGNFGEVRQGTQIPFQIKVTNKGTSVLAYNLVPDCGCFSPVPPGGVPPGKTVTLTTFINTTEYAGTIHKGLVLYSNDPQTPTIEIPVTFTALPAYRIFRPDGDTVIVPDAGTTIDVLLALPKDSKLFPERYEVAGMPDAKISMEPWQGTAPDPDMDEPSKPRQGYIFHIKVPGRLPVGRTGLSLSVTTSDRAYPVITYDVYLQKGIVALPENVFLSDMTGVMRAGFRVSRHGKPFQILKVESSSPDLKAVVSPVRGQVEYQVDLTYDGLAPKGSFDAVVKVRTDDSRNPVVSVEVTGTVR